VSGQIHAPGKEPPADTHWLEGWVSPRVGLDDVEKRKLLPLLGLELRPLHRPARSQSLYRLRYPHFSCTVLKVLVSRLLQ
jgi:hypothetical protein